MWKAKFIKTYTQSLIWPLLISSFLSIGLFICRYIGGGTTRYWFLLWNLGLAWLPLLFATILAKRIRSQRWTTPRNIILTLLWLGFLPNSFYLVSDFVHLRPTGEVSLIFDTIFFMSFAWNGLLLGCISLLIVHAELLKRLSQRYVLASIGLVVWLCSFAMYLGRYLSWNTWDIIVNPAGILYDVSERIINPQEYPSTYTITALFFVSLSVLYYVFYMLVRAIKSPHNNLKL